MKLTLLKKENAYFIINGELVFLYFSKVEMKTISLGSVRFSGVKSGFKDSISKDFFCVSRWSRRARRDDVSE